jgi:hypothetical protein
MKRTLDGREFVSDLKSGLTETELMEKYRITSRCLQRLYKKLLQAGAISPSDLRVDFRACLYANTVEVHSLRAVPREAVVCPLLVYLEDDPDTIGRVIDISPAGLGTAGLNSEVGNQRTLIIASDKFFNIEKIVLSVICRWSQSQNGKPPLAGWEIIFSDHKNKQALDDLLKALSSDSCFFS